MPIQIVFETHSISNDNENGLASGWNHSFLSPRGRELATGLGERRRQDGIDVVFTSDLRRASETAEIAFPDGSPAILRDWRLRECDYGQFNGMPAKRLHADRCNYLESPYPGGESWRQAITRAGRFLQDLTLRWGDSRVLVIGHMATRWALEHYLNGTSLEQLCKEDFVWQAGWEYRF